MVNSPSALTADAAIAAGRRELSLNSGWEYHKGDCSGFENADFNSGTWTKVNIPHNTSLYTAENKGCYKGISCYRKPFRADESVSGKRVVLRFDGVMQSCEVFLNERAVAQHKNANTPFSIDISGLLKTGDNLLCVRCDSRAHESFTPGKETPDFQYFGGIHRNVSLTVTDSVYIGDELLDRTAAGGGLFVTAPFVSKESADIRVKACVHNDSTNSMDIRLVSEISLNGTPVASAFHL